MTIPLAKELDKILADFQLASRMQNQVGNKGWENSRAETLIAISKLLEKQALKLKSIANYYGPDPHYSRYPFIVIDQEDFEKILKASLSQSPVEDK